MVSEYSALQEYPFRCRSKGKRSWQLIRNAPPNNMAGIEFVACLETIKEFLQKSWKHTQIHRRLKDEGRITMSYGAFCYHMRRLSLDRHRPGEQLPAAKPKPAPIMTPPRSTGPRHITAPSNKFPDPRDMNPNEAI